MEATTNGTARGETRDGFALVTTLLIILVLGVIAIGAAWLASAEKKTSFADSVHMTALYSADAGGEAAINFIRLAAAPPPITNFASREVRDQGQTALQGTQTYAYNCRFVSKRPKPGWGIEYLDYDYRVNADGRASQEGRSAVRVLASRLFREGY